MACELENAEKMGALETGFCELLGVAIWVPFGGGGR